MAGPILRPGFLGGLARRRLRLSLLSPGRRLPDAFVDLVSELREILDEQVDELRGHRIIVNRIGPGATRVENRRVDPRHRHRYLETEVRVPAELDIVQATIERCVQECTRLLDRHALANTILAAGPAGFEQPALHPTLSDAFLQEVAVN